jgi:chitodextrinase
VAEFEGSARLQTHRQHNTQHQTHWWFNLCEVRNVITACRSNKQTNKTNKQTNNKQTNKQTKTKRKQTNKQTPVVISCAAWILGLHLQA